MSWFSKIPGFGFRKIASILSSVNSTLAKFNQTVHGSIDAAEKTTAIFKSGANGVMTAKGVKDCVEAYQCSDYICLTVSAVGTAADISNHFCGNIPGLNQFTPLNSYLSVCCKSFVHLCKTGNITFSCNDLVE